MRTKTAPKTISIKAAMESAEKTLAKIEEERKASQAAEPSNETEKPEATKILTEKQASARAQRQALKDLCNTLQAAAKAAGIEQKPNELLREFYASAGHTELKTFDQWKEAGFFVRKGEKAILLWGHPKPSRQAKEAAK